MFPLVGGADKLEKVKIFMKRERYKRVYAHFRASSIGCLHSLFFFQVTFNHATHKKSKLTNLGTAKECTNISSHSRIFFLLFLYCTKTMATTISPFEKNTDAFTFSIMDYFYNYFNVQKLFLFKLKNKHNL